MFDIHYLHKFKSVVVPLFWLDDNFHLKIGQARVAQTSREVAWDSGRATPRACDIRWVLNSKRCINYFHLLPTGAALLCAIFTVMFQDSLECAVPL